MMASWKARVVIVVSRVQRFYNNQKIEICQLEWIKLNRIQEKRFSFFVDSYSGH